MYSHIQNEKGATLLICLAIMFLLTGVALMSVNRASTDIDLSYNQIHSEKAFYIAEAGIKKAVAEIEQDINWSNGFTDVSFSDGEYSVIRIDSTIDTLLHDTILLISTGSIQHSRGKVQVWMVPEVYHPFAFSMFADELMDIRNSLNTDSYHSDSGYATTSLNDDGDIGSNGTVSISNGAFIGGDAFTSSDGDLIINTGATVTGDTSSVADEMEIPSISADEFSEAESNNAASTGLSGSYTYNPMDDSFVSSGDVVFTEGIYYFSSFVLKNSASLSIPPGDHVEIYVEGDIEIRNSGDVNPAGSPSDLIFYSSGDLLLNNSSELFGVFYCPDGTADLRNSSDYYGSIVANQIIGHNSADFHYDRKLKDIHKKDYTNYEITAWNEIDEF